MVCASDAVLSRWQLGACTVPVAGIEASTARFSGPTLDQQGDTFIVSTSDARLQLRRWDDLAIVEDTPSPGGKQPTGLDTSRDGKWLAVAEGYNGVYLVERDTGAVAASFALEYHAGCVRFDPSGRWLATAWSEQGGCGIRIDRVHNGTLELAAELDPGGDTPDRFLDTASHIAFSPDGALLALFATSAIYHEARPKGWRGDVVVYDVATWSELWVASVDACVTHDGRSLKNVGAAMGCFTEVLFADTQTLMCGAVGCVLVLDATTGQLLRRVEVPEDAAVVSLALDSDSTVWVAIPGSEVPICALSLS